MKVEQIFSLENSDAVIKKQAMIARLRERLPLERKRGGAIEAFSEQTTLDDFHKRCLLRLARS